MRLVCGAAWHKAVLAVGLVLVSYEAAAVPFIFLDPRANAMGGAGVAAGSGASASFVNPALLMVTPDHDDVPVIAALRVSNPKNIQDEVERYQGSNLEAAFETALANYKADASTKIIRDALGTATQNIISQLNRFSDRAAEKELGAGFAVGVPGKKMAVVVDVQTIGGSKLVNVAKDYATYAGVLNGLNNNLPPTDSAFNIIVSGPDRNLQTTLLARGATISEVGLAMAKDVSIAGHKVAVGITPKYVDVTTFDYTQPVSVAIFNANEGQKRHSSVNLDLGMVNEHGDGWKSAIALKNLIPHKYQTALGNSVAIQPQLRAGVTHRSDWLTTVLDFDLNESRAVGYEANTQYVGLGAEVDVTKSAKLRAGYRYNISDRQSGTVTAGVGFGLFGAIADVAMALNEDELGLSARLGLQF